MTVAAMMLASGNVIFTGAASGAVNPGGKLKTSTRARVSWRRRGNTLPIKNFEVYLPIHWPTGVLYGLPSRNSILTTNNPLSTVRDSGPEAARQVPPTLKLDWLIGVRCVWLKSMSVIRHNQAMFKRQPATITNILFKLLTHSYT